MARINLNAIFDSRAEGEDEESMRIASQSSSNSDIEEYTGDSSHDGKTFKFLITKQKKYSKTHERKLE